MAHSLSAKKRIRQNLKRRALNRSHRSNLKTNLRAVNEALVHGDVGTAESKFRSACQLLDREASRGLVHRNAAARRKSRMARRLNAMRAKAGE